MKVLFVVLFVVAACIEQNEPSLLHHWPFNNDNGIDVAGNMNVLDQVNLNFSATDRFDVTNSAVLIDKGYMTIPAGFYLNSSRFTISAWVFVIDYGANSAIIHLGDETSGDSVMFTFSGDNVGYPQFDSIINTVKSSMISPFAVKIGEWTMLTVVFGEGTILLFINGTYASTQAIRIPSRLTGSLNYVGRKSSTLSTTAQVIIDDLQIFNVDLGQQQLLTLMTRAHHQYTICSGQVIWAYDTNKALVNHWNFEQDGQFNIDKIGHVPLILVSADITTDRFNRSNSAVAVFKSLDKRGFSFLPTGSYLTSDSFTVTLWMKAESDIANDEGSLVFSFSNFGTSLIDFYADSFYIFQSSINTEIRSNSRFPRNAWSFVSMVFDQGYARIYWNAKQVVSGHVGVLEKVNRTQNFFGQQFSRYFSDSIFYTSFDDIKFFSRALNSEELLYEMSKNASNLFECPVTNCLYNCSDNGICSDQGSCECYPGYTGNYCESRECPGACYSHGACMYDGFCSCFADWSGWSCEHASCPSYCQGKGTCYTPGVCTCYYIFKGETCSECYMCVNGICDNDGYCNCSSPNWGGPFCDQCGEGFFGPGCVYTHPVTSVSSIVPISAPSHIASSIDVFGDNFDSEAVYYCVFGSVKTEATFLDVNHLNCQTPIMESAYVDFNLEAINSTLEIIFQEPITFMFYYVDVECNNNQNDCGEYLKHGYCKNENCVCLSPWHGAACSQSDAKPEFVNENSDVQVNQFSDFAMQLTLEGTETIFVTLIDYPKSLELTSSRLLSWTNIATTLRLNPVAVRAQNTYGESYFRFNIQVVPVYSAKIDNFTVTSSGSVELFGRVLPLNFHSSFPSSVPVTLIIRSSYFSTDFKINMNVKSSFKYVYKKTVDEFGRYESFAYNPLETASAAQVEWELVGMGLNLTRLVFDGATKERYRQLVLLTNSNKDASLTQISWVYSKSAGFNLTLTVESRVCQSSCIVCQALAPNQSLELAFDVYSSNQVSSFTSQFTLTAAEKVSRTVGLSVNLIDYAAALAATPGSFDTVIATDNKVVMEFDLSNKGNLMAPNCSISWLDSQENMTIFITTMFDTKTAEILDPNKFDMGPGRTARVTFTLGTTLPLSSQTYTSQIIVSSPQVLGKNVSVALPISYRVSNNVDIGVLNIRVEDEFTYFAADKPYVANATIVLTRISTNKRSLLLTNQSGVATFEALALGDYYQIDVDCSEHSSKSQVWQATQRVNYLLVFLNRISVRYIWNVTPKIVGYKYKFNLVSEFAAYVPMPVVITEPTEFNLADLEASTSGFVTIKIINYGLIAANDVEFTLPLMDTLSLSFELPYQKFDLAPNSSVELNINIASLSKESALVSRRKRSTESNSKSIQFSYTYDCGHPETPLGYIPIYDDGEPPIYTRPPPQDINFRLIPSSPVGNPLCDSCLMDFILCMIPCGSCMQTALSTLLCAEAGDMMQCAMTPLNIFGCVLDLVSACAFTYVRVPTCVTTTAQCYYNQQQASKKTSIRRVRREFLPFMSKEEIGPLLVRIIQAGYNVQALSFESFGSEIWLHDGCSSWLQDLSSRYLSYFSEAGMYISHAEYAATLEGPYPEGVKTSDVELLLERLNNTQMLIDDPTYTAPNGNVVNMTNLLALNAVLDQDLKTANDAGFISIYDWYSNTLKAFDNAPTKEGTCARVAISINQELVLTGQGFEAELQIMNQKDSPLTNLNVTLEIRRLSDDYQSNRLFSVGHPELSHVDAVNGTGVIDGNQVADIKWLIVPYSTAAPYEDTAYTVAGTISYLTENELITFNLYPATITAMPTPSLELIYFLEKYIQSDDPLTPEKEPSLPFTLGLLLANVGHGVANSLQIQTSQPEMIKNEKGLLVDMKIISASLNNKTTFPSLSIDMGDVEPSQINQVIWSMTSSIKGTFGNLSVTMKSVQPNSDEKLTQIDRIEYKELYRMVLVDEPERDNDQLPDFLVMNEFAGYPNLVYLSNSITYQVNVAQLESVELVQTSSNLLVLRVNNVSVDQGWFFCSIILNSDLVKNLNFDAAIRAEDGRRLPKSNVWKFNTNKTASLINIFDYASFSNRESTPAPYSFTYQITLRETSVTQLTTQQTTHSTSTITTTTTTWTTPVTSLISTTTTKLLTLTTSFFDSKFSKLLQSVLKNLTNLIFKIFQF